MSTIRDLVSIRQLEEWDLPFILDSFKSCLSKYTESIVKGYTKEYSKSLLTNMILSALNNKDYSCFVCCHKNDSASILGYVIASSRDNHIFFHYTKHVYRHMGIQKDLLLSILIDFENKVTVQWPTKEMLKLQKQQKVFIENRFVEQLMESDVVNL